MKFPAKGHRETMKDQNPFVTKMKRRKFLSGFLSLVCLFIGLTTYGANPCRAGISGSFRIFNLQIPYKFPNRLSLEAFGLLESHTFSGSVDPFQSKTEPSLDQQPITHGSFSFHKNDPTALTISIGFISLSVIVILLLIANFHRRRAAKSLKSARDRYESMFNNTAVALFEEDCLAVKIEVEKLKDQGVTDMEGYLNSHPQHVDEMVKMLKILDVNPAALRLYGADSKEDLFESLGRIFTPDALDGFKQVVKAIAEGMSLFECETVSQKLTGQRIHVILNATLPAKQEEFASIIISVLDITERKRSIEVMHRSEERFRNVFNNAASGMALVDLRGHYIRVNEAFQRMLGYTAKELEWKNWREVTYPEDIGLTKRMIISLIAGQHVQPLEKRYITKEGRTVWALLNIALIVNKHRKPLYYITQVQDISELKEEQKKMHAREERYRQIFEADLSGFYIADPGGKLVLCNKILADILGFTYIEEAIGMNLFRFFKDPELGATLLHDLTEKKKLEHAEAEFTRRDGAVIHVRLNAAGRFTEKGQLIEILGYVMDITRQKNLEAQLLHAQKMTTCT
jgi:PAS domain S-box-containing protein